jgi:hypothetical protein
MDQGDSSPYSPVVDYLQQGDIFRLDVVTPVADTQKRLFRAQDGRHGSVVLEQDIPGHLFDEETLCQVLSQCDRTPLHTAPFVTTESGWHELVVVQADMTTHFLIASQTCDICGVEKPLVPAAIILPIQTIRQICRNIALPIDQPSPDITIEKYLAVQTGDTAIGCTADDFAYPEQIRTILARWTPTTNRLQKSQNTIRNFLNNYGKKGWLYPLRSDAGYNVPESVVDFSVAYTVPTKRLQDLKGSRVAQLAEPYRSQFVQAFANRFSRVAVPKPMGFDKF